MKCLRTILLGLLFVVLVNSSQGQDTSLVVRIAKLVIDSSQLDAYKAALKVHAETAVKVEPGVLNLYAVYEKNHPTQVTVFEIYADAAAYQSHLRATHFLQYKAVTQHMVKSLQLIETVPIALQAKYKTIH